jgi:acetyl-CoA carboxylase carboxyltransferase component/biotin carboxyl carrier protein
VGTAEFAVDPEAGTILALDAWTGSDPGRAATEEASGLDLAKLELHLALGGTRQSFGPGETGRRGHALAIHVDAADPERGFVPALGILQLLRPPTGPGIRTDPHVSVGEAIPAPRPGVDGRPGVVTLIARGRSRDEAMARARRALDELDVLVEGGATTTGFAADLLDRWTARSGDLGGTTLRELGRSSGWSPGPHGAAALVMAAILAHQDDLARARARFLSSAARGRPEVDVAPGRTVELEHQGHLYRIRVQQVAGHDFHLEVDGVGLDVVLDPPESPDRRLAGLGRSYRVHATTRGSDRMVQVNGVTHRVGRADRGLVRAPAPSVVVAVHGEPGQRVKAGDPLIVLEAMKMETTLTAPWTGTVRRVMTQTNVQVDAGAPLLQIVTDPIQEPRVRGDRVSFESDVERFPAPKTDPRSTLEDIRRLILGFDVDPGDPSRPRAGDHGPATETSAEPSTRAEDEILELFGDLCSLFAPARPPDSAEEMEVAHVRDDLVLYLRTLDATAEALSPPFVDNLRRAVRHYGLVGTEALERTPELEDALFRMFRSRQRIDEQIPVVVSILDGRLTADGQTAGPVAARREMFDRLAAATRRDHPQVSDLATEVRYRSFDQAPFERAREDVYREMETALAALMAPPRPPEERNVLMRVVVECPQPLERLLFARLPGADPVARALIAEVLVRRFYRIRQLEDLRAHERSGVSVVTATYAHDGARIHLIAAHATSGSLSEVGRAIRTDLGEVPPGEDVVVDFYLWRPGDVTGAPVTPAAIAAELDAIPFERPIRRIVVATATATAMGKALISHLTFRSGPDGCREEVLYRGLHPMMGKRLQLWRLSNFEIERRPSVEDVYLFHAVSRENPKDERLVALAEVRDLTPAWDESGRVTALPHLERMLTEALAAIRMSQSHRPTGRRLQWNRVLLHVLPVVDLSFDDLRAIIRRLAPLTDGLGLEKVVVLARWRDRRTGDVSDRSLHISNPTGRGLVFRFERDSDQPLEPLSEYMQKVVQCRQRGLTYPYEIVRMITPSAQDAVAEFPPGEFIEHDLNEDGELAPVHRPPGTNTANIVVGLVRNVTPAYPEGMTRVILLGDPSRALGSLAEPECRRIIAGLDLAEGLGVPLEWFAVSAGAKISMESGTENMDWIGRVLRRLIEYTQGGGEVNVVVSGINVGAQPYWNAEATMLMHTRGILVMTPDSAMVLTGKQALDYSGGVSAEDNFGIGGYEGVMGPNGQAQYWAPDLDEAAQILFRHYEHTYVMPGERFPRRLPTVDPVDRDVRPYPHRSVASPFRTVGEIFSDRTNPGRKKPFDIRGVMHAVVDQDLPPLERWTDMRDAGIAVVWDAHIGGYPVCLLGLESRPLPREGIVPADGPDHWTSGTLFPQSSKKVARAINGASGNRPVVVLANLSGFDGSPDSMRSLQLEYGAEIGRAVTNFRGPMVFVVISRYHGGAFVVFSATLNDGLEIAALEGSYASVIGGAPAAAVVFSREVEERTKTDAEVAALTSRLAHVTGQDQARLRHELDSTTARVRSEKLGQVADEYDRIHDIERARRMGSVKEIIPAARLRPYLIDAIDRGIARELERIDPRP